VGPSIPRKGSNPPRGEQPLVGDPPNKGRWERRDDLEFNELDVRLRISYKTVLLVFVLFDVLRKVVDVSLSNF